LLGIRHDEDRGDRSGRLRSFDGGARIRARRIHLDDLEARARELGANSDRGLANLGARLRRTNQDDA
jgi:hypothetical protein